MLELLGLIARYQVVEVASALDQFEEAALLVCDALFLRFYLGDFFDCLEIRDCKGVGVI